MGNVMVIPAKRQVGNNIKKAEKPKAEKFSQPFVHL